MKTASLSMPLGLMLALWAPGISAMRLTGQKEANHLAKMGSCTDQDIKLMEGMGGGWQAGTFPELGEKCGKQSWKWNGTYNHNKHVECLQSDLPISAACGSCFALQGEYGFSNCKGACVMNWCSKKCVKCLDNYADTLNTCVGVVPPGLWACDGSGYKPKPKPLKGEDGEKLISHPHVNKPSPDKPAIQVPATPVVEVPATPVVEVPVPAPFVQTGACTESDMKAMNAAGPGPETGSLASSCAACGSSSVSWTMQMQDSKYKKCLQGKVPISGGCASCFLDSAKYGLGNCKMPCMSNWCSKGCLQCVESYQPEIRKCVGFAPPVAWSCDGSGYGVTVPPPAATTATTTPPALAWQPEKTLPVGHSISFYNSESRRFLRMTENGLVGGPEKGETATLDDDERFIVVDASDDRSGDLVALYSKVHGRFVTLAKNFDTSGAEIGSVAAATPTKPKQGWTIERIAVVSVAGFGNVKAVALGCADAGDLHLPAPKDEEPEAFIKMGTGGALTTVRELPRELPLTMDSEAGTTFVIIDGHEPDQDRNRTWPPALVEPETNPAIMSYSSAKGPGPSMTVLVCGGVALLLLGAAGGYFLARRKLMGAGGEREWTNMASETPEASGGVIS